MPLLQILKAAPVAAVLPLTYFIASTDPKDTGSHISHWAHWVGLNDLPPWLTQRIADHYAITWVIIVAALYVFAVWGIPWLWRTRANKPVTNAPQKPTTTGLAISSPHNVFLNLDFQGFERAIELTETAKGNIFSGVTASRDSQEDKSQQRILLTEAARLFFEALERSGLDDMTGENYSSPDVILNHMKYLLLSAAKAGRIVLYGAKPPSHQTLPIAPELMSQLAPGNGWNNLHSLSRSTPIDFRDVWLTPADLDAAISDRIELLKRVNEEMKK